MKIFQVVPYYPPHIGGMEFYVQQLSEELAKRGHEVTVFTSSNIPNQTISRINGVTIYSLKIITKLYNIPIVPNIFWRLIDSQKPDVIHTHQYPVFFSDVSALYARIGNIPLMVQVHVISEAKSALSGHLSDMYYSTLGLRTLRAADSIVIPSLDYKQRLSQMHIDRKKLTLIPYGINTKKFEKVSGEVFRKKYCCENAKIILSVGRLNYQKGFEYLIKAMPAILKQVPIAKLFIVGEGDQLNSLKKIAKTLQIEEKVVFTGAIGQTDIADVYAAADVFVLPSLFESFGISMVEAQAAGKPVIGTNVGGVPETLLPGETGFLVKSCNPHAIESCVLKLLSNDMLAKEMGERGKWFAESKFSIDTAVERIIKTYDIMV